MENLINLYNNTVYKIIEVSNIKLNYNTKKINKIIT